MASSTMPMSAETTTNADPRKTRGARRQARSADRRISPGRWGLRAEALPELERIVSFLEQNPRQRLTVQGHADAVGSDEANALISLRRAQAIRDFLVQRGIEPSRVAYEGLGAAHPIASNDSAGGRERNRRVEIVLHRTTS